MKIAIIAKQPRSLRRAPVSVVIALLAAFGATGASADEPAAPWPVQDGRIGYVLTGFHWAVYASESRAECPEGFNDGPREQYAMLFPKDGKKRTVLETELAREGAVWFPGVEPEPFVFKESISKIAPGLNLDGKSGPNDFVSPDGEQGIDNRLSRALGCVEDYRPGGSLYHFNNFYVQNRNYARVMIELTKVDSLVKDDDVTVTTYRGFDPLLTNAGGTEYLPYGSQRADMRWGKTFIQHMRGKITNGVLTTEPADINFPYNYAFSDRGLIRVRAAQFKLNLTAEQANGMWGGYIDTTSWYLSVNQALGTHSLSYGRQSSPSIYWTLNKLADGFPDPATGQNTAISGAAQVTFRQVFIEHPNPQVASGTARPQDATPAPQAAQKAFR